MKKIILILISILSVTCSWAFDGYDVLIDGIAYNLDKQTKEASVTQDAQTSTYSGRIVIPSTIVSDGVTYTVTSIGNYAFQECRDVTFVSIPGTTKSIGTHSFAHCTGLTSIQLPNHITTIGHGAFSSSGLTTIKLPYSVTELGAYAFMNCQHLTSVEMPNVITGIYDGVFDGCSSLASVKIPETVTRIYQFAFYGCTSLTDITIPNAVTSIGLRAFSDCTGLIHVTIGSSVKSFEYGETFHGCTDLTFITNLSTTPQDISFVSFDLPKACKDVYLYVPDKSVNDYKNSEIWKFFNVIGLSNAAEGIEDINADNTSDNRIFNISGQQLTQPQKGINIRNGKKYLSR